MYLREVGPRHEDGHGVGGEDGPRRLAHRVTDQPTVRRVRRHREHVLLVRGQTADFQFASERRKFFTW